MQIAAARAGGTYVQMVPTSRILSIRAFDVQHVDYPVHEAASKIFCFNNASLSLVNNIKGSCRYWKKIVKSLMEVSSVVAWPVDIKNTYLQEL